MKREKGKKRQDMVINEAVIVGTVREGARAYPREGNRSQYYFKMEVFRNSGIADIVPVWTSVPVELEAGARILVSGRMCARNVQTSDGSRLMVYVYADSIIDGWQDNRKGVLQNN